MGWKEKWNRRHLLQLAEEARKAWASTNHQLDMDSMYFEYWSVWFRIKSTADGLLIEEADTGKPVAMDMVVSLLPIAELYP